MKGLSAFKLALFFCFSSVAAASADFIDLEPPANPQLGLEIRNFSILQHSDANFPGVDSLEFFDLLSLRGKAALRFGEKASSEVHLLLKTLARTAPIAPGFSGFTLTGSSSGFLIDPLNWQIASDDYVLLTLQPDRLLVVWQEERLRLTVGRQPITHAHTFFWNPIDWLTPFTPNTFDRSFKPGTDALMADIKVNRQNSFTLIYAFGADADFEASAVVGKWTANLLLVDIDLLVGKVRQDVRFGYGLSATPDFFGGGALRMETAYYLAYENGQRDFLRATVGYDRQWSEKLFVLVEYYYNGFGSTSVSDYASRFTDARFLRGEVTNVGEHFVASSARYEVTPLLQTTLSLIINAHDGSLLVAPEATYSLADEVDLKAGATVAVGEGPIGLQPSSEFGSYPHFFSLEFVWVL